MNRKKIKALRRKLGLTQAEFAKLVGVRANTAARWEQGVSTPRPESVRQLKLLGSNPSARAQAILLTTMEQTILGNMDKARGYGCTEKAVRTTAQKAVDEWRKND